MQQFSSTKMDWKMSFEKMSEGNILTHWGRVTHICVIKLTITGSDNGLSPGWRQAIILTSAGIFLIGHLGANFSKNHQNSYIFIQEFSFKKMRLKCRLEKLLAILCRPQYVNLLSLLCLSLPLPRITRFMGPTWGPYGADRTQVGPCWPHELCYLGRLRHVLRHPQAQWLPS